MTTDVAFDSVPKSKLIDGIYGGKMVNSVSKVGELYSDMEFDEEELLSELVVPQSDVEISDDHSLLTLPSVPSSELPEANTLESTKESNGLLASLFW